VHLVGFTTEIPLLLNLPRTTTFQNPTLRAIYHVLSCAYLILRYKISVKQRS